MIARAGTRDIEATLVGALVVWPDSADSLPPNLAGSDFADRGFGAAFEAIKRRHLAGDPITGQLVALELTPSQADTLEAAVESAGTAAHIEVHAQAILAAGVRRQLASRLEAVAKAAERDQSDPMDMLGEIARLHDEAESRLAGALVDEGVGVGDGLAAVLTQAEAAGRGELTGIQTGLSLFDLLTGGLQRGTTLVIGARTSLGKSALAGQIAVNAAQAGAHVAVLSFEMPPLVFYRRFAAGASGINGLLIRDGRLSPADWSTLTGTCSDMTLKLDGKLRIYGRVSRDINAILATARRLHRQGKLDLFVIDFLQKLQIGRGIAKVTNRNSELEQISGALSDLARELQVPVIIGSQLNRTAEGTRPTVSSLRDSGAIEQDADVMLAIHGDRDSYERELIVLKNRDGRLGIILARFDPDRLVFTESSDKIVSYSKE